MFHFFQKFFFHKAAFGRVLFSFDDPVKTLSSKTRRRKWKKIPEKINLSPSVPVETYNACSDNPAKKTCENSAKHRKNPKKQLSIFPHTVFFLKIFLRAQRQNFWKPAGNLYLKIREVFSYCSILQIFLFVSKFFISQTFLWTGGVQFWQSCQKLFAKN